VGLGFLSPLFLLGLVAIAIPIALHLFRHEAGPVQPFSAVRFLQRAPEHRARRRRLRDVLLLALRVAALALLALSFARPYLVTAGATAETPVTVIAVDRSFSLSAPGQIEQARELAGEVIDAHRPGGRIAVVAFDERAEVVLAPTGDRAEARAAVAAIEPGYATTRYGAAVAAAADLVRAAGGRLVVISDLQSGGWTGAATPVRADLPIEARVVSPPASNLVVSDLRRTAGGVTADVHNSGPTRRTTRVALRIDGRAAATQPVSIASGDVVTVSFKHVLPDRGELSVDVEDGVGYRADDRRFAALEPAPQRRLLVIVGAGDRGAEGFYFARAIAAAEGADGMVVETVSADRVASRAGELSAYSAVALLGSRGFDARAAEAIGRELERGCGLLVAAGPALDWPWLSSQFSGALGVRAAGIEAPSEPLSFAPADVRHPVFRAFGRDAGALSGVRFGRFVRFSSRDGVQTVARFADGSPALMELSRTRGRTLLLASDLGNAWNDLALHPGFVPFVHELVRYLSADGPVPRDVPVGFRAGPDWQRPGIVTDHSGGSAARIAVNVDLRESARATMTAEEFLAAVPRDPQPSVATVAAAETRARESEQSWWRYGVMLMLAGLVAESVIGRKR
jgi:hypothetical protein